ncbi:hypothetical protein TNCV_3154101, partial [Trichonephila clavipes]
MSRSFNLNSLEPIGPANSANRPLTRFLLTKPAGVRHKHRRPSHPTHCRRFTAFEDNSPLC